MYTFLVNLVRKAAELSVAVNPDGVPQANASASLKTRPAPSRPCGNSENFGGSILAPGVLALVNMSVEERQEVRRLGEHSQEKGYGRYRQKVLKSRNYKKMSV